MALGIFDIIFKVTGAGDAVQALRNIKTEAKQAAEGLDKTKDSTAALAGQVKGLLVGGAVVGFAKGALEAAAQYDSLKRAVATTVSTTSELTAQMGRLEQIAALPGINLEQSIRGFVGLRSVRLSASEAESALKGMANAIASTGGSAETLAQMTKGMTDMAAKTSVSQEEINQLVEASAVAGNAIEAAFGTRSGEAISKMGITGAQAVRMIAIELGKLPQATAGIQTAIDNVGDATYRFNVALGQIIANFLEAFGPDIIKNLETATNLVKTMAKEGTALNTVMKALIGLAVVSFLADMAVQFNVVAKAVMGAVAAMKALNVAVLIGKAAANPALGIAAMAAAAIAGFGAYKLFDEIDKASKVGTSTVEATGGKTKDLIPPAVTDIGKAADTASKAGKSTEGKGGGLINTMVAIAEYAARMQAAFVDMAKSMEGHLFEIAKNTGSTRDLLDLRKQTFGGGRLGAIGVTASEIQNAGNNATNQGGVGVIPQTLIPASTDLERSMRKMMIQYGRQNLVTEMRRI
jgi:tape measure domain-containing protein